MVKSTGYQNYYSNYPISQTVDTLQAGTVSNPTFRCQPPAQIPKTPPDTVEISGKDSKKENKNSLTSYLPAWITDKRGLAIDAGLASIVFLPFAASKGMAYKVGKVCKNKIVRSSLPEVLDFKEAKTVEDGIKFAKDTLKIKDVDNNFSLEAINYVNKMIVDVSNAHYGKLVMPQKLSYNELQDNIYASVSRNIFSKSFGELTINKKYFDDKFLTEKLNNVLNSAKPKTDKTNPTSSNDKYLQWGWSKEVCDLAKKFKSDPTALSLAEKRSLHTNLKEGVKLQKSLVKLSPSDILERAESLFVRNGIKIDINSIKQLSTAKQQEKVKELFTELKQKLGQPARCQIPYFDINTTIYHEMGHLQDYAQNLDRVLLEDCKIRWSDIWHRLKNNEKLLQANNTNNHWGSTHKGDFKVLFESNRTKFQTKYPDFYEFLTDEKIQRKAGKVSPYAQSGIGEFIAEVYAKMIKGDKLSDDVIALYKEYNGPEVPKQFRMGRTIDI